jgi:lipid-A-disaccharide synthase
MLQRQLGLLQIAKQSLHSNTLVNLIMDEEVVTELIQEECTTKRIREELTKILEVNHRNTL